MNVINHSKYSESVAAQAGRELHFSNRCSEADQAVIGCRCIIEETFFGESDHAADTLGALNGNCTLGESGGARHGSGNLGQFSSRKRDPRVRD